MIAKPEPNSVAHSTDDHPVASVIITAHNEGDEVRRTIHSVLSNTEVAVEIIVVDDGSSDGCCEHLAGDRTKVIRHEQRVGVAASRDEATRAARGDVLSFLDGHQRVSRLCIDHCANVAARRNAIVWPDVQHFRDGAPFAHGASFCLTEDQGYFAGAWLMRPPRRSITRITALTTPGYVIPRNVYRQVKWPEALRCWGGSEAAVSLKAFFTDVQILHACGPLARHLFKDNFQYKVDDDRVWRNQAIIARVCFADRSWHEYWYPRVFDGHLNSSVLSELESDAVVSEHEEFMSIKRRTDEEFWSELLQRDVPQELSRTQHPAVP